MEGDVRRQPRETQSPNRLSRRCNQRRVERTQLSTLLNRTPWASTRLGRSFRCPARRGAAPGGRLLLALTRAADGLRSLSVASHFTLKPYYLLYANNLVSPLVPELLPIRAPPGYHPNATLLLLANVTATTTGALREEHSDHASRLRLAKNVCK